MRIVFLFMIFITSALAIQPEDITALDQQIKAVCPIDGVSANGTISFSPTATSAQISAANALRDVFFAPGYVVPKPIPTSVAMSRARIALSRAGYLTTLETAIANMQGQAGIEARIYWATSSTVDRAHPLVATMAAAIGLTSAQMDALFIAAAALP